MTSIGNQPPSPPTCRMNYQKVYMNHMFSSSTMSHVTRMWRNQLLCDAIIKTGNVETKAHRLVLIAACPMLQHMDNASLGSHLEVRMAPDIKKDSVMVFLQYLYEGYMMLTEKNCKDIQKIGKLLQVDGVLKCCSDFLKCLSLKTGMGMEPNMAFQDNLDHSHIRATHIQRTVSDMDKRTHSDVSVTNSSFPRQKRSRLQSNEDDRSSHHLDRPIHDLDDRSSMTQSYRSRSESQDSDKDVVEIMEDSLEVVMKDPVERDQDGWPVDSTCPPIHNSQSISVASKQQRHTDLQVLDVCSPEHRTSAHSFPNFSSVSPVSLQNINSLSSSDPKTLNSSTSSSLQPNLSSSDFYMPLGLPKMPTLQPKPQMANQIKAFAAGSNQQITVSQQSTSVPQCSKPSNPPYIPRSETETSSIEPQREVTPASQSVPEILAGNMKQKTNKSQSEKDEAEELTIVKIERTDHSDERSLLDHSNERNGSLMSRFGDLDASGGGEGLNSDSNTSLEQAYTIQDHEHHLQASTSSSQMGSPGIPILSRGIGGTTEESSAGPPFTCYCGEVFESTIGLDHHVVSAHVQRDQLECPICYKTFLHNTSLRRHFVVAHSESRPFECKICNKSFKRKDVLKQHVAKMHQYTVFLNRSFNM